MALDPARLHRPVGDWQLPLAGPIVRRVTRTSVAVFLAATESFTVTLELHPGVDPGSAPLPGGEAGVAVSLCLGTSLHVCVVEKKGLALQPGTLYGYDLEIHTKSATRTLGSLKLLEGSVPLGYVKDDLPGFVLPMALDELQIAHASCRKSHGCHTGKLVDPDALPIIDSLIEVERTRPRLRLQQLYLTGDQIYCDDVPAALLAALTSAGRELPGCARRCDGDSTAA